MLDAVTMEVPPDIGEPSSLKRRETVYVSEVIEWPVRWSDSGVEVSDEQKRVIGLRFGD